MATIEHNGKSYQVDEKGFLVEVLIERDENWSEHVMTTEGIHELTPEHKKVLDEAWRYYKKNGLAPMLRVLSRITGLPCKRIYELFPSGFKHGACKMLGLREKDCF